MAIRITDFERPEQHPYSMLLGMELINTHQAESLLAWMLVECIDASKWITIQTKHDHGGLVAAGLLREVGERQYQLTERAKGLLYGCYAAEVSDEATHFG